MRKPPKRTPLYTFLAAQVRIAELELDLTRERTSHDLLRAAVTPPVQPPLPALDPRMHYAH